MIATRIDSIPASIARRAAATPDGVAVVDGDSRLTFGELERRSDALAARLQAAGAGPDGCVGIYLNRSGRFVVAALAAMKSGAAYVPLDPSTPAERVSAILADAGAIALVTDRCELLPPGPWAVLAAVAPDDARSTLQRRALDPDGLAYVIYTSGSTGEPKGVEITHANLCNLADWHVAAFAVAADDRASQVASLGFDAAVWEIWPALAAGATLHIADEITRRSSQALFDWFVAQRITIGFVPTALAGQLVRMAWPADTALRVLLTGGDTLHDRPAAGLPFAFVNNYGPTECTVVATSGTVRPDDGASRPPSIGMPIADATALILDHETLEPVAAGAAGELCIGGALVGRGYRNRPELTSTRFIRHRTEHGEIVRLYRTGDRAMRLANGEIAFLGRLDDMLKIRGYRIEPGEIEACLNRCAGIAASAVAARDVGEGGPALVAYVVADRDAAPTASAVAEQLAARLPDYMVPAYFVSLPELPVTANGKVDKAALPAPCETNLLPRAPSAEEPSAAGPSANGHVSARLSALVASMLGQPAIAADENFFMAGGHSMLGAQLVARIRDTFGVKLTLRQLFMAPTVAALSAQIAQQSKSA